MKRLILSSIVLCVLFVCCSAPDPQTDATKWMEDFKIFQSIYEKANAGLYRYHSRQEVDSVFAGNKKSIGSATDYRAFYNILWNVIDYTGSCHNYLYYPNSLEKALKKKTIFFPLPVRYINNKLYCNLSYKEIKLGSEILSVNKIPAQQFVAATSRYASTDGHNVSGKYAEIDSGDLPFFVYYAYGEPASFEIEYEQDHQRLTTTLLPVPYDEYIANFKARFIPEFEKYQQKFSFKNIDSGTALLRINTFNIKWGNEQQQFESFLDSVFSYLKNAKTSNLVVDVRRNGGGADPNDLLLYSYLTQRTFRAATSMVTLVNALPFKEYYCDKDDMERIDAELARDFGVAANGKLQAYDSANLAWKPNSKSFKGKLYLLVGADVASAASMFASMVKSDTASMVIGEETAGGYYGHTGNIHAAYCLPNSQLELEFALVDMDQDVQTLPDQKPGDGIKPDYQVAPTIKDYLLGKDVVLEFTKKLIKR